MAKRLRVDKKIETKYKALLEMDSGKTNKEVAKALGIPPNTLSTWKKNKKKIFEAYESGNAKTKRMKQDTYEQVNKALFEWLAQVHAENIHVSGNLIKEKALYIAKELNLEMFQASDGWLHKWKKRYDMLFKTDTSESVMEEMTAFWLETILPTILSRYKLENIFNADEFSLFYEFLPKKTFHIKEENYSGGKHSKVRLTGMAAGNAKGERLPMFVIGKSENPRCFKGVKSIPCHYRAEPNSWMSSELFEEWVRELDHHFGIEKRKIALIVDNCPAHSTIAGLQWIEVLFLPPNIASAMQPMNQGVIRLLKAKYFSLAVKRQLNNLEKGKELPKFEILTAMTMLNKAWCWIPDQIFMNCFKKSDIYEESIEIALSNINNPFANLDLEENVMKDLQGDLQVMKEKFNVDFRLTAEELVDIDFDISMSSNVSDADFMGEVSGYDDNNSEEDHSDNEDSTDTPTKPQFKDAMNAISLLEDYSVFMEFGVDLRKALNTASHIFELENLSNKRQTKIEQFFN